MSLDEYQKQLCSVHKQDVWWGGLTIELSCVVGSVCGAWSDIINCSANVTDEQLNQLQIKLFDKLGDVLNILARLNWSIGVPISNIYSFAYHEGMGDSETTKYVLRLAKSSSEFLCPDMTDVNDANKFIMESSILIMHDLINLALSLDRSLIDISKDNLIKVLSKEKGNDGNHGSEKDEKS